MKDSLLHLCIGVHSRLRENSFNMFVLGELRSDIYNPSTGWTGESNKVEEITSNILSQERPGLSNFAGYIVISTR